MLRLQSVGAVTALSLCLTACQTTIPKEALQLSAESFQTRQSQTRRFDTPDEKKLLTASAQVLQDLGFNIESSETDLGLIAASKERDATEAGQVVGSIVLAVILGVSVPWDKNQKINASLVTKPVGAKEIAVRVTFQRMVWNTHNQVSKIEAIDDVKMYQEFFDKLSQSVFLEANQI
jgi:hypothetical protein